MDDKILRLTIELDKKEYERHEHVMCTMTLTNIGNESLRVNKRLLVNSPNVPPHFREVTMKIVSPSNQTLKFESKAFNAFPQESDITELLPSSSVSRKQDLTRDFSFDEIGRYTIQAIYENQFDFEKKMDIWKGRLESNIIEFEIR